MTTTAPPRTLRAHPEAARRAGPFGRRRPPIVPVRQVDNEAQRELVSAAGISSIPTLMAFRDGMLDFHQPGALPAPALEQVTSAVRELHTTGPRAEAARLGETADNQTGSTR